MNSLLITRLSDLSAAVHSSHKESSAGSAVLSVLNDYPNNCFLISTQGWMSANRERGGTPGWLYAVKWWGSAGLILKSWSSQKKKKKCLRRHWQGLGYDGETPSLLFPILSRAPPIIAGLNVRRRAGLCMWAMGAVSFLSSPGPADWFPWQVPPSRAKKEKMMTLIQSKCLKQL